MKHRTAALWIGFVLLTIVVIGQEVEIYYLTRIAQAASARIAKVEATR